ncbi:uncharacterized protein LOC100909360 [Galendromus occidentalis]|uniref:Uncharacterized protein LOC100909360 n=1 Tax=Galendromus occidentalis TaxID=34638 RepID=A0AAJ7SG20_9ACAR|nr:uncharacterized protein LOC100909360 [Galendromus occidentalis]
MACRASLFAGYEQGGTFYCDLKVNGTQSEEVLFGTKLRYIGASRTNSSNHLSLFNRANHHFGYATNGAVFHIVDLPNEKCYGFCYTPSVRMRRISGGRLTSKGSRVLSTFKTGPQSFEGSWSTAQRLAVASSEAPANSTWRVSVSWGSLRIKGNDYNCGVLSLRFPDEHLVPEEEVNRFEVLRSESPAPEDFCDADAMVVAIDEEGCRHASLSGGKGSSLAALYALSGELGTFTVPRALVVTTRAYEKFASQKCVTEVLEKLSEDIRDSADPETGNLSTSDECVRKLSEFCLPQELRLQIEQKILETIGPLNEIRAVAVRSSAVGEDSEEMSAAGQMSTFLNLKELDEIYEAVVKCWASQFSVTALNYKRQYGQKLEGAGMAVVIQEMVNPDAAGVMFTCDPVSGHPGMITITANYGLGESVVSAQVDPDTFVLKRNGNQDIHLDSKTLGKKDGGIFPRFTGGVLKAYLNEEQSRSFCLSDSTVETLARVGAQVEAHFDRPRDIEWAVKDDQLFLLQSRPITSIFAETEYETTHDLDCGVPTNREVLSRANLDEVMPGCLTPMTLDLMTMNFDVFLLRIVRKHFPDLMDYSLYSPKFFHQFGKKAFLNASQNLFGLGHRQLKDQALTTIGTDMNGHEVFRLGIFHESLASKNTVMKMARMTLGISYETDEILRKGKLVAENFSINLPSCATSSEMVISFLKQLHQMKNSFGYLSGATIAASSWMRATIRVLRGIVGKRAPAGELMSLFSKLMRSELEVESADIPENLRKLASCIKSSNIGDSFVKSSPEEALLKLQGDEGEAGQHFRDFLRRHGHRCYKEFDLASKPWDMDPVQLIKILQSYGSKDSASVEPDVVNLRPGFVNKKLLEYTVPRARKAVFAREAMKSAVVKCIHEIRKALLIIAARMRGEYRLPREELIFYLTLDEMYRLAKQHDSNLVSKARRRERLHPKINREKFPVIICGIPQPEKKMENLLNTANKTSSSGMTVSEGTVTGVARVIHDFEKEAHLIQNGEILITHCTDTGWTPYFPMLSGIVTEIGGIISHGAVVAREFGLPALVGVIGATETFRSGDMVVIDGNSATVSKLKPRRRSDSFERKSGAVTDLGATRSPVHSAESIETGEAAEKISLSLEKVTGDAEDAEIVPENAAQPDISSTSSHSTLQESPVTKVLIPKYSEENEVFVSAEDLLSSEEEGLQTRDEIPKNNSGKTATHGGEEPPLHERLMQGVQRCAQTSVHEENEENVEGYPISRLVIDSTVSQSWPNHGDHPPELSSDIPYVELESEL